MKPKLVLLHGALGSKNQFEDLLPLLKDDFEVYSFNFEGHGGVATNKSYSIQLFTQNTSDYLKEKNVESAHFFGYSMGGYVALNLASQEPNRVLSIVTLATKFDWNVEEANKQASMLNPEIISLKVPHFANKLQKEHEPLDWKNVMNKTAAMMVNLGDGAGLSNSDFKKIEQNVYLGVGSKDHMVSIEETKQVSEILARGEHTVLENIPHPIEKIEPSVIAKFIRSNLLI